jgi:predicted nucleic acid-binding protein
MVDHCILDTNVLINLYRAKAKTIKVLGTLGLTHNAVFAIAHFNYVEFVAGTTRKNDAEKFLRYYPIVDFDKKSHLLSVKLSRNRKILLESQKLSDFLIASICIAHDYHIATTNIKDFTMFEPFGLKIIKVPQSVFD